MQGPILLEKYINQLASDFSNIYWLITTRLTRTVQASTKVDKFATLSSRFKKTG
jgi:hypothetical protein